ncbi:MAG: CvpA family protein [Puniceicoccales bacterium]|jgi:hypothetical protein|nr:CvpA family protein [Puniceicoccales bacterium]
MPAAFAAILAVTPVSGSKTVLCGCFLVMVVVMFIGARHGYWRGPLRQLAPTVALPFAIFGAWVFGAGFGHWVLHGSMVPWLMRGVCGMLLLGSLLWLGAFAVLWRLGRSRFPSHMGEVENPVLGAVVGCWTGVLWSVVGFLLLAAAGSIAQIWLDNTRATQGGSTHRVLTQLVVLKNSLALCRGAGWLRTWNPLPTHTRRTLEKGLQVLNTPGALIRLQRLQPIRAIATDPAFYPLTQDPEIRELVFKRDIEKLITHPAVLRLLSDDAFQRQIAEMNLESLFDEALRATAREKPTAPIPPTAPARPPASTPPTAPAAPPTSTAPTSPARNL